MNKEMLIKEIGNWFGDYTFEDGKYKIDNGEEVFEYSSADECLFDWLPTLVESDEDTVRICGLMQLSLLITIVRCK